MAHLNVLNKRSNYDHLKIAIILLSIVVFFTYLMGLKDNVFLFNLFIPFVFLFLLFVISLVAEDLIWNFFFLCSDKKYKRNKLRFIFLFCFIFLFLSGWTLNHFYLPEAFHPISLLTDVIIILLTIFLGYSLIKQNKKNILFISTSIFILFFLLIFFTTDNNKNIKPFASDAIKSLPYATWIPIKNNIDSDVIKYDQKKAFNGINLYNSRNLSEAYLIDMYGEKLHTWSIKMSEDDSWSHIEMCKNGNLFAIVKDKMLIKLDWNSDIKWIKNAHFHHDIDIAENKDIYILARKDRIVFYYGLPIPILNDYIMILSPDGKIKREISLFNVFKNEVSFFNIFFRILQSIINPKYIIRMVKNKKIKKGFICHPSSPHDIFHTNTIEIIRRNIPEVCRKGDILISLRELDLVAILDTQQEKIIWKWGPGNVSKQHHPIMLENGNILIFDNGCDKNRSRIVELDPQLKKIIWQYESDPPDEFFSLTRGSNQRLQNGNTLITESDKGHVFEVTKNGDIVWEFYNPEINKQENRRAAIYRMMRISLEDYSRIKLIQ